jgi:hypothetical protein
MTDVTRCFQRFREPVAVRIETDVEVMNRIDVPARALDRLMPAAATPDLRHDGATRRHE